MNQLIELSLILLLFCIPILGFTQTEKNNAYGGTRKYRIDNLKVYNKPTGDLLEKDEYSEYLQLYPNNTHSIIDKYGKIIGLYIDLMNPEAIDRHDPDLQPQLNEKFPEFVFRTRDGRLMQSNNLTGSYILIRFELSTDKKFLKEKELAELNSQLIELTDEVSIISVFLSNFNNELIVEDPLFENFHVINDAYLFHAKYFVNSYPTTMLIDTNGILMRKYDWQDKIDLKNDIGLN